VRGENPGPLGILFLGTNQGRRVKQGDYQRRRESLLFIRKTTSTSTGMLSSRKKRETAIRYEIVQKGTRPGTRGCDFGEKKELKVQLVGKSLDFFSLPSSITP